MLKVLLLGVAPSVLAWTDNFDIDSEYTTNFLCDGGLGASCQLKAPSADTDTDRTVFTKIASGDAGAENIIETTDGGLFITPAASNTNSYEFNWNYNTPVDLTNGGADNSLIFDFSKGGSWSFGANDLGTSEWVTAIVCTSTCTSAFGYSLSSIGHITENGGIRGISLPDDCVRLSQKFLNEKSDGFVSILEFEYWRFASGLSDSVPLSTSLFSASGRQAWESEVGINFDITDFSSVGCLAVGGNTIQSRTASLELIESSDVTEPSSLTGDPHLVGFHGERAELKNVVSALYSIYCDSTTMVHIRTEPDVSGAVYISEVRVNVNGDIVTIDVNSFENFEAHAFISMNEETRKMTIDTAVVSMEVAVASENSVRPYLDFTMSARQVVPAGGILGRTLASHLTADDFANVEEFVVSDSAIKSAHVCAY